MLKALDKLEDHPVLYLRTDIDCLLTTDESGNLLSDPVVTKSQVYFLPDFKPALLDLPHLDNYTDSESLFVKPDSRTSSLFNEVKLSQN